MAMVDTNPSVESDGPETQKTGPGLFAVLLRKIKHIPRAIRHPRSFIKRQSFLRPLLPVFRFLEHLVRSVLVPFRTVPFLICYLWLRWFGRHRITNGDKHCTDRRIVMLVCTNLEVDPRVRREAEALAAGGFYVTIICTAWGSDVDECESLDWGANIAFKILPMHSSRFICSYPYLYSRMLYNAAVAEDAWAYHAHDLDMSFIVMLAAAQKKVACVCDFHEWYSQNVSYDPWTERFRPHHFFKRILYEHVEYLAIHYSSRVVTVCQSIRERLESVYQSPKAIRVVRNIPELAGQADEPLFDLRRELNIPEDQRIVLYQGGMGQSRNLEPVIEAMKYVANAVFVIRGPGHEMYATHYDNIARKCGVSDRVFCLPPVPHARVVTEAKSADVGLWTLLSNVGLNFKLALPNKVFEYLAAGLPILAADLPEVRALIDQYDVGLCFSPDDPECIAHCINQIVEDGSFFQRCRENIGPAMSDLRADEEWNKLVDLYQTLPETR